MTDPAAGTPIAELFARDPLKLTTQDLDAIIAKLRQSRAQYNLGEKSAGNMKATKSPKATKTKLTTLDLKDLGLL